MTTFASRIGAHVQAELDAAAAAERRGNVASAFRHLERAHVLGQATTGQHVRVHLRMLRLAVRNRLAGEAVGEAWRIAAASLFTPIGRVPAGNTGGANVGGFRRMPIARDLQRTLDAARAGAQARQAAARRQATATLAIAAAAALGLLGMGGCSAPPKNLDLSLDKASAAGLYRVALLPPAQAPAINQMHSWKVQLATPDGAPVHGATFAVDGGMPQHGHGLPTQPRVARELGDGSYQLDGMKFSMTGWWEVKLDIHGPRGGDKVTFNTVVDRPSERR